MRRQNVLRTLLFIIFFSVGAATLSGSILCDDLVRYYHNRQLLKAKEELSNRLRFLNSDYDALLQNLEKDPNLFERIALLVLGTARNDANTIYPKATEELLEAVKKALEGDSSHPPCFLARRPDLRRETRGQAKARRGEPVIPAWLSDAANQPGEPFYFWQAPFWFLFRLYGLVPPQIKRRERRERIRIELSGLCGLGGKKNASSAQIQRRYYLTGRMRAPLLAFARKQAGSYIWAAKATLKIAPVGFAVMISTKPLCAWAIFFTRARPRPVPVVSRVSSAPER